MSLHTALWGISKVCPRTRFGYPSSRAFELPNRLPYHEFKLFAQDCLADPDRSDLYQYHMTQEKGHSRLEKREYFLFSLFLFMNMPWGPPVPPTGQNPPDIIQYYPRPSVRKCANLPRILYAPTALPGVPFENAFHVQDETGMKCGSAAVVEYINHAILPERPLNYYISISAENERAFDMLMGAVLARAIALRHRRPGLPARVYTPCKPYDAQLLRAFQEYGFQNDDAIFRMRRILSDTDKHANPPVGCAVAPVALENDGDADDLLNRVNAYSVTARSLDWLTRLQQEQMFHVFGVWQEERLLGEMVLSAYGAEGRVEMLYTRPEFRRRGIATALMAYAGRLLFQSGIRSLNAEVWRRNDKAMSLFETLRFESVSAVLLYPGMDL